MFNIFKSNTRKKKLKEFAERISSSSLRNKSDLSEMLSYMDEKPKAESELFSYLLNEPDLSEILKQYDANIETVKEIYNYLVRAGAGQWTRGYYVAIAAIGYPETLSILLGSYSENHFSIEGMDHKNSLIKLAYEMCIYFDKK